MGLFDKITESATNVSKSVMGSAMQVCSSATVAVHEQGELVQLKSQVNVIEQELDAIYVQIGRRYVDNILATGEMSAIDVTDSLKLLEPKLEKKMELEKKKF